MYMAAAASTDIETSDVCQPMTMIKIPAGTNIVSVAVPARTRCQRIHSSATGKSMTMSKANLSSAGKIVYMSRNSTHWYTSLQLLHYMGILVIR